MRWPLSSSLRSMILWMFVPIMLVFIPFTSAISYWLASEQLKANAETSIRDTVSQTRNFLNDRLTALLSDLTSFDNDNEIQALFNRADRNSFRMEPQDYVLLSKRMDKVYADFYTIIDSIVVYYRGGRISISRQDYLKTDVPITLDSFLHQPFDSISRIYWSNLHENDLDSQHPKVVSLYKWLGERNPETGGIMIFNVKEQFFRDILSAPKISSNGYMMLLSPDGVMSFKAISNSYDIDETALQKKVSDTDKPSGELTMNSKNGKEIIVLFDTIGINKWKVAAVFPKEELYVKVNYIKYVTLYVMAGVIAAVLALSGLFAHFVTKPLTVLTRKINSIEQGNLDVILNDWPNNEIGILNKGIKDLLMRIKTLLAEVEKEQEKKRLAEFSVLQAQIHPHFLYNTLYSIKQLCDMGETKDASQMVTALSHFFRTSISKGNEIIPLAQEIEHIETYLYIQKMRYGDDFIYEIVVPSEMLDCMFIKLTLQPLIENAIYHGVKRVRRTGMIRIEGELKENLCLVRVQDNGAGMDEERLDAIRNMLRGQDIKGVSPIGFGVMNVQQRLRLHFGLESGLSYESRLGEGTTVIVQFTRKHNLSSTEEG